MAEDGVEGARGGRREEEPAAVKAIPPYMKAVSGSMGGIVEACCLQPIDVIKTRLQLDRTGAYKGIVHCGTTVWRTEGVRALWKGLTPFATHLTLKYALRMGSNALLQSAFKDSRTGALSQRGRLMAGFGAGVLEALVIVTPFEAVEGLISGFWLTNPVCCPGSPLTPIEGEDPYVEDCGWPSTQM